MEFRVPRDGPLTSRQQIWVAATSCLMISALAVGAVSQSPSQKANPDPTGSPAVKSAAARAPDHDRGKRLFEGHCGRCHGMQGGGGTGANLRRPKLDRAADDARLFDLIRDGIPESGMPSAWVMSDNEVRDVIAYVRALGRVAAEPLPGDPAKGKLVYQNADCSKCHIIAGDGGSLGPELTEIGARRGLQFLGDALLHPGKDRAVAKDGYTTHLPVLVVKKDGRVLTGIRMNEDTFTIQMRDTENRFYSLKKSDLEEQQTLDASLMPAYEKTLSQSAIDQLVSYLASLRGRP
jgi:cytochrome c oxidase cbb3-type subunit 3